MSKKSKLKINEYEGSSFEASKLEFNESRIKTFKMIAAIGIIFGLLSLAALIVALPFKTVELAVIRVNEITGDSDIITTMDEQVQGMEEVVNKFNVARYIKSREGYLYDLIRHDYDFVVSQTDKEIVGDYQKLYTGSKGRAETLQDQVIITPIIRSITLAKSNERDIATVRLILNRKNIRTDEEQRRSMIITLGYFYNNTAPMSEAERLVNPFGFVVTSYRVDIENE